MEVHFTLEQEAQLAEIAHRRGANIEEVVKDAALLLLRDEEDFRLGVERGIAAAQRGDFVEHEDVWVEVEKLLRT